MTAGISEQFTLERKAKDQPIVDNKSTQDRIISIILPTYNEAENIPIIIPRIFHILAQAQLRGEVIVVDDNSPDHTGEIAEELAKKHSVRTHIRKNERGLATAIMKGFDLSHGDICVVMDADMSHPVETFPAMVKMILDGKADIVVGSRCVEGGSSEDWDFIRRGISKGARSLAIGITDLKDPTSGFMAIRKQTLDGIHLDPIGWKIILETVVKADSARVREMPITFKKRALGKSKLNLREYKNYLLHLFRLYCYKYPLLMQFIKFCSVGFTGLLVDTTVLVCLVELLLQDPRFAAIFAFVAAASWNYLLNRSWTFDCARTMNFFSGYFPFVAVCAVGLGVRVGIMHLLIKYVGMGESGLYVFASLLGIMCATIFNFLTSKYIVFPDRFHNSS